MIDRRELMTSLAAAAVGVVPALPASAAPPIPLLVRSGLCSSWRSNWQPLALITATFEIAMCSRWHVDMRGRDDVTYLHVPTGFYFAVYPEAPNEVWGMCAPEALPVPFACDPLRKPIFKAIVFAHHNNIALARRLRGRGGSFIVDYQDPRYAELVREDAPPLPRVESFAARESDWVGRLVPAKPKAQA